MHDIAYTYAVVNKISVVNNWLTMDTIDYKNFFYDDISTEDSLLDNIGWVFDDDVLDDNLQVCISKNFFYDDVTLNGVSSDDHEKIVQQVLNGVIVAPNISAAVQQLYKSPHWCC